MKRRIQTARAPAAIGPYAQAIVVDKLVYSAGQVAIDPQTGKMVEGDISVQTARVLDNLAAVLEAAGTSLRNVVKTTVFLSDFGNFAAMNAVYASYFDPAMPPARSTVEVSALPLNGQVEIECVALIEGTAGE